MSKTTTSKATSTQKSTLTSRIRKHLLESNLLQIQQMIQKPSSDESFSEEYDIDLEDPHGEGSDERTEGIEDGIMNESLQIESELSVTGFLEIDKYFVISVFKSSDDTCICLFEPPHWMTSRVRKEYRPALNSLVRMVQRIARYFENTQQGFLSDPIEMLSALHGKWTQKGFVEEILQEGDTFDKSDISLIKDNIWFTWSDKCMQFSSIFKSKG